MYFQDLAQDDIVGRNRLLRMANLNKITPRNTRAGAQAPWWKHAEPSLQALGEVTVSLHPAKGGHTTEKREFEHLQSPLQQKKTNSHTIGVSVSLLFPSHALMLQPKLHSRWIKIALVKTFLATRLLPCLTFIPMYHLITTQRCRRSEGGCKLIKIFPVATPEISQSSFLANQSVSSPINGLSKF